MIFGGIEKFSLIDFPGKTSCILFTIGCNFRCPYCHNPELVDETVETKISEEEILDFLKTRKTLLDGVVITGGEPTLHDDLISFIKKIKELGFLVKLDTNGTNPKMLREALDKKLVDYVAMDMKSPLAKYSQTVARPVDTKAIRESIDLLLNSNIGYEFRTTLIKAMVTPSDILEIGKEIKGAKNYYLQKFIPTKILNPQFKKKVTYTDEELRELKKELENYVTHCGIR